MRAESEPLTQVETPTGRRRGRKEEVHDRLVSMASGHGPDRTHARSLRSRSVQRVEGLASVEGLAVRTSYLRASPLPSALVVGSLAGAAAADATSWSPLDRPGLTVSRLLLVGGLLLHVRRAQAFAPSRRVHRRFLLGLMVWSGVAVVALPDAWQWPALAMSLLGTAVVLVIWANADESSANDDLL